MCEIINSTILKHSNTQSPQQGNYFNASHVNQASRRLALLNPSLSLLFHWKRLHHLSGVNISQNSPFFQREKVSLFRRIWGRVRIYEANFYREVHINIKCACHDKHSLSFISFILYSPFSMILDCMLRTLVTVYLPIISLQIATTLCIG